MTNDPMNASPIDSRRPRAALALILGLALVAPAPAASQPLRSEPVPLEDASRFLAQATLGADHATVRRVSRVGYERWLLQQLRARPTSHLREFARHYRRFQAREDDLNQLRRMAWWRSVLAGRDVLRQRVAFALSEIFVVSDRLDALSDRPHALASYYDVLVRHALGNYRELLRDVSMHPAMGIYLSHLNNDRSDPDVNRFPDENYAREVMQLFSIGLHELAQDGSPVLDGGGDPIPTYGNAEVREFAKVFTGFGLDGEDDDGSASFGSFAGDYTLPMRMYDDHHEPGEKRLLRGLVVPAGQSGMADFEMAIDNLFHHPNVGPFIGRRLIQRLVTSNPSPAYVERIAQVFADDGDGVRGNLAAVVIAILLDPEARSAEVASRPEAGRLREPFLRVVRLLRTFPPRRRTNLVLQDLGFAFSQYPLASPSVFNFFQPDFAPGGAVRDSGLVAPEFQITTSSTAINWANVALYVAATRAVEDEITEREVPLRLNREMRLARDPEALIDHLDLLLTYGTLSEGTRNAIHNAIAPYENAELRLIFALYLFLISPDWNVVE